MNQVNYKLVLSSLATAAIFLGCSGDNSSVSSVGTAYYIDSAVEGIDFSCGSQSGITDKEGKFRFEAGQRCQFSLGGILLGDTASASLQNNGYLFEDDSEVAQFLQCLDNDGDDSSGGMMGNMGGMGNMDMKMDMDNMDDMPGMGVASTTLADFNCLAFKLRSENEF